MAYYNNRDYDRRGGYNRGYDRGYNNRGYDRGYDRPNYDHGYDDRGYEAPPAPPKFADGQKVIVISTGEEVTVLRKGREQYECRLKDYRVFWFYESELAAIDDTTAN